MGRVLVGVALGAFLVGCSWVSLSAGGEAVRVAPASVVAGCQKVGRANAKTADRVVLFARTERAMAEELRRLARNEAADLGGDTVVATAPPADGRQAFDVYRCRTR